MFDTKIAKQLARMVKIEQWSTAEVSIYMKVSISTVQRALQMAELNKWDLHDVPVTN